MVMIGNLDHKLKTGRYLDYPGYAQPGHRTMSNLFVTLLQLAGSTKTHFGQPDPALKDFDQHGPLSELFA